jgi:hypothetical protein
MRAATLVTPWVPIKCMQVAAILYAVVVCDLSRLHAQGTTTTASAPTAVVPPDAPINVHSDYTLGTTTVTLNYCPKRRPTSEAVGIIPGKPPEPIKIKWASSSGAPPAEAVVVELAFTYNGIPCLYTYDCTPLLRQDDHYELNLSQFASDLITQLDQLLPLNFDPVSTSLTFSPVSISVAPVLPRDVAPMTGLCQVNPMPQSHPCCAAHGAQHKARAPMMPEGVPPFVTHRNSDGTTTVTPTHPDQPIPAQPTLPNPVPEGVPPVVKHTKPEGTTTVTPTHPDQLIPALPPPPSPGPPGTSTPAPKTPLTCPQPVPKAPPMTCPQCSSMLCPQCSMTAMSSSQGATCCQMKLKLGSFVKTTNDLTITLQTSLGQVH